MSHDLDAQVYALRYALGAALEHPGVRMELADPPPDPVFIAGHPRDALDWARANPGLDDRPRRYRMVQRSYELQGHRGGTLVLVRGHHRADHDLVEMAEHRGMRVVIG